MIEVALYWPDFKLHFLLTMTKSPPFKSMSKIRFLCYSIECFLHNLTIFKSHAVVKMLQEVDKNRKIMSHNYKPDSNAVRH